MDSESPAKILLVDDRPENLLALEAALSGLGHELVPATSGPEALRRMLNDDFALVLLDVQMPEMDGFETASVLRSRARSRHTPIIFLTAINKSEEHVTRGYSVGAVDYVFKPYSPEILRAKVTRFVELAANAERLRAEVNGHLQASQEQLALNMELERRILERTAEVETAAAEIRLEMSRRQLVELELRAAAEEIRGRNEELQRRNEELVAHNERLAQVDEDRREFLAMLSHELRNPLSVVSTAAHLMGEFGLPEPRLQRLHATIVRQAGQLSQLVDELLDASRITHRKITLVRHALDLCSVVRRAADDFAMTVEGVSMQLSLPAESVMVQGDPTRLAQVVVNLLRNAVEHGGPHPQVHLTVEQEGTQAVLRVRDFGAGISPELLPRIFDLFVQDQRTPDRAQGGLGLGLCLVRDLVLLHGGTVEARSDGAGRGAEFLVRIPLLDRPAAEVLTPAAPAVPCADCVQRERASKRVLIVEDNRDAAETISELLELWGFEAQVVLTAAAALPVAAVLQPAVFILDIGLPDMDGYELIRRLRSVPEHRNALVIALTGYGQEEDRRHALEAGFDHHLTKPVDPVRLKELLTSAVPVAG